jgi:hypothetical protein
MFRLTMEIGEPEGVTPRRMKSHRCLIVAALQQKSSVKTGGLPIAEANCAPHRYAGAIETSRTTKTFRHWQADD